MKSKKTLDSFVKFCKSNPNLRFWQALRNWSKFSFIYGTQSYLEGITDVEDTYYFEGKDR